MKTELVKFDQMKKTWYQIAKHANGDSDINFELEIHKKLLNIFHVGDYYYYIVNLANVEIEFTSDSVVDVLKIDRRESFNVKYLVENIHPDDIQRFAFYEQKVTEFFNNLPADKILKYKVSYDYRLRKGDGSYIWVLMQTVTIQTNEDGAVIRVLGVHTNITHLKTEEKPSGLSFLGLEGEPSYYNVDTGNIQTLKSAELFTMKEKEILRLVVQGKTTKEIAAILFRSVHTINTHRKNIFQKTRSTTTADLAAKCLQNNWV
jgi:DNA-binding CsgD family transcriptional regulator